MTPEQVLEAQGISFRDQAIAQGKTVIDVYPGDREPAYPVAENTLVMYHIKPREKPLPS